MPKKCLMIETPDKRKFFTHEKNYTQLLEFSKNFGAELSIVKADNPEILDLISLAPAICDKTYNKKSKFEVVEVKICKRGRTRKNMIGKAADIRAAMKNRLLEGKSVVIADLAKEYSGENLSLACFCNHLRQVRKELEKTGSTVIKTKRGVYTLKENL